MDNEVWDSYQLLWSIFHLCDSITADHTSKTRVPNIRMVCWSKPSEGVMKLNVDGSSLGNPGRAGFGGLLRGEDGVWVIGFTRFLGLLDNLHAELMAIYEGLRVAWSSNARVVLCVPDSVEAVRLIRSPCPRLHPYAAIIANINALLRRDWNVNFHHTLR